MLSERPSSVVSFASRLVDLIKDGLEEMSEEELRLSLEETMRANRTLTLENDVFERYLRRKDPQSLQKLPQVMEAARQAQKVRGVQLPGSQIGSVPSIAGSFHRPSKTPSSPSMASGQIARTASGSQHLSTGGVPKRSAKGLKLTCAHRNELANKEIEDMKKQYREFEKVTIRKKRHLHAQLEEMKYRTIETKETAEQFEKDVVSADPVPSKIPKEKFIRFVEEQLKLAATIIDKFNLKIVTAKRFISQTKMQLAQRKEFGSSLRRVDFQKLEIEKEYLVQENEDNQRILTLIKQISGYYNLQLKYHKDDLLEKKAILQSIEKDLVSKRQEKIDNQRCQIETAREVRKALGQLSNIKELKEEYEIPEVLDFLHVQRELDEAKKNFKRLNRKRNIQLITLRLRQKLN